MNRRPNNILIRSRRRFDKSAAEEGYGERREVK